MFEALSGLGWWPSESTRREAHLSVSRRRAGAVGTRHAGPAAGRRHRKGKAVAVPSASAWHESDEEGEPSPVREAASVRRYGGAPPRHRVVAAPADGEQPSMKAASDGAASKRGPIPWAEAPDAAQPDEKNVAVGPLARARASSSRGGGAGHRRPTESATTTPRSSWLGAAASAADAADAEATEHKVSPLSQILLGQGRRRVSWPPVPEHTDGDGKPDENRAEAGLSPVPPRLMRLAPNAHVVSLENIARLYLELQADREYLVRESEKCYRARSMTANELRDVETALADMLTKKQALEDRLELLGERDELSRLLLGNLDEKVGTIGSESSAFEERIRQLKGAGVSKVVERALQERRQVHDRERASGSVLRERHQENIAPDGTPAAAPAAKAPPNRVRDGRAAAAADAPDAITRSNRSCLRTLYGHTGQVLAVDVSADDRTRHRCAGGESPRDPARPRGWVHAVALHASGTLAVSGSSDRTARLWRLLDADDLGTVNASSPEAPLPHSSRSRCVHAFRGAHRAAITAVQMDDTHLVTGSADHSAVCWDLASRRSILRLEEHLDAVRALQFWRYGLATASADGTVKMWDLRSGRCHRTLHAYDASADDPANAAGVAVTSLQFDETRLVTGGTDECVRVWDLRSAKCTSVVETGARVNAVRFDATRLYAGCADQVIRAYDLAELCQWEGPTSSPLRRCLFGHTGAVQALALGACGLVSGAADQTVRVWSAGGVSESRSPPSPLPPLDFRGGK
eukprot:ctg_2042.g532